jgi:hypothetical protein
MTPDIKYGSIVLYMIICGLGIGPAFPLYTLAIQNAVDVRKLGQATSASQFFRQIGGAIGAAVLGTILASSLSTSFGQLHFPGAGQGSSVAEGSIAAQGTATIGERIRAQFAEQYQLIERVIRNNDEAARQQLLSNPLIPEEFKQQLSHPAQTNDSYNQIEAAVLAGDAAKLEEALNRSGIPAFARDTIRQGASPVLGNAEAAQAFLGKLEAQMAAFGGSISAPDPDALLSQIKSQLDQQAEQVIADVTQTVKVAFTDAITKTYRYLVFVVLIGWLASFFIPELELRRSHAPAPVEVS